MKDLISISEKLLKDCLDLKAEETFLVVTDRLKREIGGALYHAGLHIGADAMLLEMKPRTRNGEEPPMPVAEAMISAKVTVCPTQYSLTHTQARKKAVEKGARVATMPGITEDMFAQGAITADYREVEELTNRMTEILSRGKEVRIVKGGRELRFSIAGRKGVPSTGIYRKPGQSGNLPSGEAYIAPVEGTAEGKLLVDGSMVGIGLLKEPLEIAISAGKLDRVEGFHAKDFLKSLGTSELARNVAEFGIGTNRKARLTGIILEDEKIYGTVHVAFGDNSTFGGSVQAGIHLDGVILKPDVFVDDTKIMDKGEIIIP